MAMAVWVAKDSETVLSERNRHRMEEQVCLRNTILACGVIPAAFSHPMSGLSDSSPSLFFLSMEYRLPEQQLSHQQNLKEVYNLLSGILADCNYKGN